YLFDVRSGTSWINDIQKQILVGGAKNFRGQNPATGTAINYWLKSAASEVKITISDLGGKEFRTIDGTKNVGLNRVQWDLRGNPPARAGGPGAMGATGATATPPAPVPQSAREAQAP